MRKIFVALLALFASAGIANAASHGNSTDLSSTWSTQMQSVPVVVPAGSACGPGTPGIVIHDDGQAENGYGWNAAAGADARLADKFTPAAYPATISNVCMSFITNAGVSTLNFKVAVYDDDGAGGAPGTLLGSKSFVATPAAIAGLPFTPTFQSFDISDLALSIPSGNVYISANWDANVGVGVFLASDETPATPLADGYGYDSAAVWTPLLTDRPNYRALMIRAVMPSAGPGAPSVSKAFAPSQVLEGVSSTLTITLNNGSQPTAAVLGAALTDTFPAGLVVASTPNAATTCASGTVTAVAGSGSVTLSSGASIPAGASCTVKVDVSSAATGSYANTIAAGALQTNHGNNAGAASATLKVGLTFPEPYCPVTFPSAVEPITRVLFDGIDNPSPTTGGPPLQDFTTIIGNVVPGQTLPMTVEGNTSGSFTTKVVAYIDWNQNGVFTDPGELYVIGDLINSTGADGKQVTANIVVPGDALGGSTRMRVMKKFSTQPAPCNSTGYGQAEDYTLNVTPSAEPTVSKSFAPSQVPANSPSSLTITLKNLANAGNATLSAALVDTFPAGLVVAAVPNASTTCGSGVVTANAGDGSVSLAAGATIPGAGQCIVKVDVQSATDGSYANQIAVGALQTDLGANAFAANATLKVGFTFPEPYCPVTFPSGVEPITFVDYAGIANPSSAAVGGSPALENFTAIIGNVSQGEVLPMSVQGNTDGNYTAVITTYIDWNQNGVFDASERYDIGSFVNSTGADGKKATANITVPAGAVLGQTRMRVTKKFNAAAEACNTTGFGQAEDYTLVVTPSQPSVSKAFAPSTIALGETSTATITLKNPTALDATLTAPLVDNLPAGMSVVSATTNCGLILGSAGAGLTGTPGASITLPAGVVLPAGTSCSITVVVETGTFGSFVNTIPAGALQTDQGNNVAAASATLIVTEPMLDPIAVVTPAAGFDFNVDSGSTGSDTLVIGNIGGSDLTYSIAEQDTSRLNPPSYKTAAMRKALSSGQADVSRADAANPFLPQRSGDPIVIQATDIAQMTDNTPVTPNGVSCGSAADGAADNSWWRRFYFAEHTNVTGPTAMINSVTVASESGVMTPVTINVYTIAHSVPVDTIPTAALTLIGTGSGMVGGDLTTTTVAITPNTIVDDVVGKDLVVEYHIDDGAGVPRFFPGGNATPQTHKTFLSSVECGIAQPATTDSIGFPDMHLIMVVNVDDGGTPPPAGCDNPANVPWLSTSPSSGTVIPGGSQNVAVTVDASALAEGVYSADLCVSTNDPMQALIVVPVMVTVDPAPIPDFIFCSGFEMGEDGSCGPPVSDDVVTGMINMPLVNNDDGSSFDFVTGDMHGYTPSLVDDINLYKLSDGMYVYWYGDLSTLSVGGVTDSGGVEFAVLQSGAVVGPSQTFNADSIKMANWVGGTNGYLGIAFENEETGELNYGYIHMTTSGPDGYPAQWLEYAYNKAGDPITIP